MSGRTTHRFRCLMFAVAAIFAATLTALTLRAANDEPESTEKIPVAISADFGQSWKDGSDEVFMLRGRCRVVQGETRLEAQKMVIWRTTESQAFGTRERLAIYLEGDARAERPGRTLTDPALFLRLETRGEVRNQVHNMRQGESLAGDPLVQRAAEERRLAARSSKLRQTQLVVPPSPDDVSGPELHTFQIQPPVGTRRRVRIRSRSTAPLNIRSEPSNETIPPEQVTIITGGVNVLIDGVDDLLPGEDAVGVIDLSADRMVIWTRDILGDQGADKIQEQNEPLQVYMEGNIEIRQGMRIVRATQAVFDARDHHALLLNAELRTFIPDINAHVRVNASRMRQLSRDSFHAERAWISTSPYGKPGYRLQASDVFLEDRYSLPWFGAGPTSIDPATGMPAVESHPWVTTRNNTVFVEDVPVLYSPYLSAPADNPNIPLRTITFGQDSIFGFQVKTIWDLPQLLGLEEPEGTRWDLLANYYSERGPGIGAGGKYRGSDLLGIPGSYFGEGLGFYVFDQGKDNLGLDRRSLDPESDNRGRMQWRHRNNLPDGFSVTGELGILSDRNFLEQYFEDEFDEGKDVETLLHAKQQVDNWAWSALVRPDVNGFENTTEWLPRGDLYVLGEPLLGGLATWTNHSSAGYAQLHPADAPTDPNDLFTPLPYVTNANGAVLMTRHELDAPFSLGPLQFVPFVMGEGAFWGDDFTGDSIDRLVGSAGIRSSLQFWRVFPSVYSRVFNLNGLAHKVRLEAGYSFIDSTADLADIPQFNEFDDDAQERFRQRLLVNTYGGVLPSVVEPRFYAVRTGAGTSVTAPWNELIDDQQVARFALRQRLQTKVGPPDRMRIKDWMTLDLEASYFPNATRDNFGEDVGLLGARYAWHVGDRTSLLANAAYDLFDDAQQLWNVAVLSQRGERGSIYVGVRQIKGAQGLDSQTLTASYSYIMGPKWISTFGTAFDLGEGQNRGQSLTITRVGLDFLVHFGVNYDASKNNAGIGISIEPRIGQFSGSTTQLSSLLSRDKP